MINRIPLRIFNYKIMNNMAKFYEHEIPDGYEARIEGNKVIIELAESEDERIRKKIIEIIRMVSGPDCDVYLSEEGQAECLAWLEKQKEHQNNSDAPNESSWSGIISSSDKDKNLDEIAQDYVDGVKEYNPEPTWDLVQTAVCYGYHYCEQKEQPKEELVYRLNGLMQDYIKEGKDDEEKEHRFKCYQLFWDALEDTNFFEQKEQKPTSTEDMPYITDEHFYEREPADSFKYKLAEYMTKGCTLKEGPDGYTYAISAETILKMAEEELLKRGVVQKPAEWSEEDEKQIRQIERIVKDAGCSKQLQERIHNWLKSLRPQPHWKPSEEQMNALNFAITYFMHETSYQNPTELRDLYEELLKLKGSVAPMRDIDE